MCAAGRGHRVHVSDRLTLDEIGRLGAREPGMKMRVLIAVEAPALRSRLARLLQTLGYDVSPARTDRREPPEVEQPAADIVARASHGDKDLALARKLCAGGCRVIVVAGPRGTISALSRALPDAEAFLDQPLDEQKLAHHLAR